MSRRWAPSWLRGLKSWGWASSRRRGLNEAGKAKQTAALSNAEDVCIFWVIRAEALGPGQALIFKIWHWMNMGTYILSGNTRCHILQRNENRLASGYAK
eukprot:1154102-Pelagomonas_calceolata.AAC.2